MLFVSFFFFICGCVIVEVCVCGLVLTSMVREDMKRQKKHHTPASEAWNVLGFGITLPHVHEKTQRGAFSTRQMRGCKSAWLWLCMTSV